ncbi:MAG: hypothetical protein R8K20_03015 [Gallionellaceae bacterium]
MIRYGFILILLWCGSVCAFEEKPCDLEHITTLVLIEHGYELGPAPISARTKNMRNLTQCIDSDLTKARDFAKSQSDEKLLYIFSIASQYATIESYLDVQKLIVDRWASAKLDDANCSGHFFAMKRTGRIFNLHKTKKVKEILATVEIMP